MAVPPDIRRARSCYDHLAGELGVRIYDQMLAQGHLRHADGHLALTPSGEALLAGLGVDLRALRSSTRPVARGCLDGTERRPHLAGSAGAALLEALLARRWLVRGDHPRSIRITDAGRRGMRHTRLT